MPGRAKELHDQEKDLVATFKALTVEEGTGHAPFRWQRRLFHHFVDANLPDAVDIPTGLGKTSVMALWLIALAQGANLPKRLVYVVDRRAVVDQATRFAERLRENMPEELAKRFRLDESAGGLPISTLRGGFADNRDWLEDPSRPAIVVGTVDMVGSRLLFEGYGVSRGMRPYHAGFLGVDTLVVLDEAHLCPPFEALLREIASHRDGALGPNGQADDIIPPFRLMSLSATGRETSAATVFTLEDEDRREVAVHERLTACKRLRLIALEDPKTLTAKLAERAIELGRDDPPSRVLVYCNSRKDAVDVKTRIDKEIKPGRKARGTASAGGGIAGGAAELLVGERRVYERRNLEEWLARHGFLGGGRTAPDAPIFLVATSAGEVGVDMDADHMVCDLVAYERMVQRLGRVNRRGGCRNGVRREALIDVIAPRPAGLKSNASKDAKRHERDLKTFHARLDALKRLPPDGMGRYDASPLATMMSKSDHAEVIGLAMTPAPLHPGLTRPLLDAWSMTSLKRHEGRPEVAPWLRGWEEEEEPQTSVVWREYLPRVRVGGETAAPASMIARFFENAPVHASEKLEALRSHVLGWLLKRILQVHKRTEDCEHAVKGNEVVALVIDRAGERVTTATLDELRLLARRTANKAEKRDRTKRKGDLERALAGATLVVDSRVRGLNEDGMLDEKSEAEVATADADERWQAWVESPSSGLNRPVIKFRVRRVNVGEEDEGLQMAEVEDWRHVCTFETDFAAAGSVRAGLAVFKWPDDAAGEDSRSILSRPQTLCDHTEQVACRVREIAARLKLPAEEIDALAIAARLHDDGKAVARWQNAMNAPKDGHPYAKTCGGGSWWLLEGYRHEFGSLLRAERMDLPDGARDLILHLIAAHHGYARPLISSAGCEQGPPSRLESTAGEAALRFARLQKRYGPWGLAWREAILRAADQGASREWSERACGRPADG